MAKTDSDPSFEDIRRSVPTGYERVLVYSMWENDLTLGEALYNELKINGVDTENIYDVVEFFEAKLLDLDKVQYYMQVLTGQMPDVVLRNNDDQGDTTE